MSNIKELFLYLVLLLIMSAPLIQCTYDNYVKYKLATAAEKVSDK